MVILSEDISLLSDGMTFRHLLGTFLDGQQSTQLRPALTQSQRLHRPLLIQEQQFGILKPHSKYPTGKMY